MFYLVWKDFLLAKKINIFVLTLYAALISLVATKMPILPELLYGFCILIFVYLATIYANSYDEKSNSELVLNSLPIERKEIVKGKYFSIIINILISGFVIILSTNLFSLGGLTFATRTAKYIDIIISFNLISIIFSIYYPIYFKLGASNTRLLNIILYCLIFFTPSITTKFLVNTISIEAFSLTGSEIIIFPLFIVCALIYCLSYHISKAFYLQRDL